MFLSTRIRITVLIVAVCASIAVFAQTSSSHDEKMIRDAILSIEKGWNEGSGAKFAAPFADDADYVIVNGMLIKTRKVIDKGHQDLFDGPYKGSVNKATVKSVRFLRPDVAIAHVEWTLTVHSVPSKAINTMVWTKEKGVWQIAAFHNTPAQGPPK